MSEIGILQLSLLLKEKKPSPPAYPPFPPPKIMTGGAAGAGAGRVREQIIRREDIHYENTSKHKRHLQTCHLQFIKKEDDMSKISVQYFTPSSFDNGSVGWPIL
jgi:hypothetical protein